MKKILLIALILISTQAFSRTWVQGKIQIGSQKFCEVYNNSNNYLEATEVTFDVWNGQKYDRYEVTSWQKDWSVLYPYTSTMFWLGTGADYRQGTFNNTCYVMLKTTNRRY